MTMPAPVVAKLGDVADIRLGMSFRDRIEHHPDGSVAVVQMKDLSDENHVQVAEAVRTSLPPGKERFQIRQGDLLFRSRGNNNTVAIVREAIESAVAAAPLLLIRATEALPEYLQWFINSAAAQAQLKAKAVGTGVQMISADAVKALDVPLPSAAAQKLIADCAALSMREQRLMSELALRRHQLTGQILTNVAHQQAKVGLK